MENIGKMTLAELVTRQSGTAAVFEKYQLDYCCQGKRSLEEACAKQGLDAMTIEKEIASMMSETSEPVWDFFRNLSLTLLVDYIVERHHGFTKLMLPRLAEHTKKVAERHGNSNPSLLEIAGLVSDLSIEMSEHMAKEEQILFPFIKRLEKAKQTGKSGDTPTRPFVSNPIRVMEMEHDHAGELMRQIRRLSNDYTPPLLACTTYKLAFNELSEFERDLHQHVHLENNLLFPAAIALEADILSQAHETPQIAQPSYQHHGK